MPSKIQIITNEHQEELKEHGTYEFPVLVSDEALSRFYTSSFQWHWHTEIELTLITEGTMVYQINDRIFHPRAGQALFGNSNTMHTGHMADGHDCKYISITFHPRLLYGPSDGTYRSAGSLLRPVGGMAQGSSRASGGYHTH